MLKLSVALIFALYTLCSGQGNVPTAGFSHPIQISEFEEYIKNNETAILAEFESLGVPAKPLKPWEVAKQPQNLVKHRYYSGEDVLLTYDHTRVVLETLPNQPGSDFIAANWVDSYDHPRRFIGTQCPMNTTANDFWRMVWQVGAPQVVNLASPHDMEKGKCFKYFPDSNTQFGDIHIRYLDTEEETDVHVRNYVLEKGSEKRPLTHLHFQSWPDLGVPEKPTQLWNLIKRYREDKLHSTSKPLVVHCVGGVGRTGTFLLTDSMIDMSKKEDHLDFFKHLWTIRNQRISMVEKAPQYYYSHQTVLEAMNSGPIVQTSLAMTVASTLYMMYRNLF